MKKVLESLVSIFFLAIGIFLLIFLLYKSYLYEALEYGIGLSLAAFIISPLSNLLFKGNLRSIDKISLLLFECGLFYFMNYTLNLNSSIRLLMFGELYYPKTKIIISLISCVILLVVFLYALKYINRKNKQNIKIILIILSLIPYFVSKSILMYQYNKITKNITVMNADPIVIKKKEVKDKYYFENNVYSENYFEDFEKIDIDNAYALRDKNGTKYILHSLDNFKDYYNEVSKNTFLENKLIGLNRYISKYSVDTEYKSFKIYKNNPKMNIWDSSNGFYYQYIMFYYGHNIEENNYKYYSIIDENGKEYYIINCMVEQDDQKINRYLSIASFDDQVYYWSFIGDYSLDEIYDFISTLNVEINK